MGFWGTNSNSGSKAAAKGQGYYDLRDHPLTLAGSCSVWKPREPLLNPRRSVAVEIFFVSVKWYRRSNSVRASSIKRPISFQTRNKGIHFADSTTSFRSIPSYTLTLMCSLFLLPTYFTQRHEILTLLVFKQKEPLTNLVSRVY